MIKIRSGRPLPISNIGFIRCKLREKIRVGRVANCSTIRQMPFMKLLAFVLGLLLSASALTFTCQYPGVERRIRDAHVIFEGKAIAYDKHSTTFKVSELYKGDPDREKIKIRGKYDIGDVHLIYGQIDENRNLFTHECSFNANISKLEDASAIKRYGERTIRMFYEEQAELKSYLAIYGKGLWRKLSENPDKWVEKSVRIYTEWGDYQRALSVFKNYPKHIPAFEGSTKLSRDDIQDIGIYVFILGKNKYYSEAYKIISELYRLFPDNDVVQQHYSWIEYNLHKERVFERDLVSFAGIDFHSSFLDFSNREMEKRKFVGCDLSGLNLSESKVKEFYVSRTKIAGGNFGRSKIGRIDYDLVDANGNDYSYSQISEFDVDETRLSHAKFVGAVVMMDASETRVADTDFENAVFDGSKFSRVEFSKVNLNGASFKGADLEDVFTFDEEGVDFSKTIYDENTIWPRDMDKDSLILKPTGSTYIRMKWFDSELKRAMDSTYSSRYWVYYYPQILMRD